MDDTSGAARPSMAHVRAVVRKVAQSADGPLSATELRHLTTQRDPLLTPLIVALAVADLRLEGKISVSR